MRELFKNPAVHIVILGLLVAAAILLAKGPPTADALGSGKWAAGVAARIVYKG